MRSPPGSDKLVPRQGRQAEITAHGRGSRCPWASRRRGLGTGLEICDTLRNPGVVGGDWRGVLYPARMPSFHRVSPPETVAAWVRWFWIPQWHLAPGRVSRQEVIAFPACNLAVESDPAGLVGLAGPTTRRSFRDLTGHGWAVGALLGPAAVPHLVEDPVAIRDSYLSLDLPDLHTAVTTAMTSDEEDAVRRSRAVDAFAHWLEENLPAPDGEALLANAMADLIDGDQSVLRVEDAADRLGVSVRTLQRLARHYVGLPPAAMIRRRRLQEAAERLRRDPGTDIAAVANDLGYADHAHLTTDFRNALNFTPGPRYGGVGHRPRPRPPPPPHPALPHPPDLPPERLPQNRRSAQAPTKRVIAAMRSATVVSLAHTNSGVLVRRLEFEAMTRPDSSSPCAKVAAPSDCYDKLAADQTPTS